MVKSKTLILIILIILITEGFFAWQYFGAPKKEVKDETADWQTYEWIGLEFKYPSDWAVEKIYYQTPAQQANGELPENIGVRLFPGKEIKGNDFIDIGGHQVNCEPSQNHTRCFYLEYLANFVYTDSKNPEILKVFDLFIKEEPGIKIGNAEISGNIDIIATQKSVDEGHQPWRLSSDTVLLTVNRYGFTNADLDKTDLNGVFAEPGKKVYRVPHKNNFYLVILTQPIVGIGKIWIISEIKEDQTAECSPIDFPGYELAKDATGTDYEFNVDLDNDGKKEMARVYQTPANSFGGRMGPNMVKVFSGTKDCPKEEFSYLGKGNYVWGAETFLNFWEDGANVVMVQDASYGMGCGGTTHLIFLTYREGKYSVIEGPQFGGLGGVYMFDGENGLGKKIIVAEERWTWTSDPPDYCCGCTSRRQFMIYTWNGEGYTKNEAGITQNKYSPEKSIGDIIQKEPSVLNQQSKLGSALYQLTQAENYTEFAQSSGLDVVDNKVRVIIELVSPGYTLPANFGAEEARYENLLQALIPIDKLLDLADDPNIKLIRAPMKFLPLQ